uniref:Replication associated protein n=1 Tax=Genomoviridae sp. TaxID=2202565 RepID=A0A8F5MJS2_9VIRU|nr:MAG: replication associated protein [Genomoviridae sp.]QXN75483.1 MAG: replication associated protein [Genomoviridae sp.]QXN75485.1 MAG: replication associated protein [Genomoviridae sp.]
MPFRFAARFALLTYSQCGDLDPFAVNDHLGSLGAECIVGREEHSDGGFHLHAFTDFGRKFQSRNERIFDVDGRHPNVLRGTRTPGKMYDYATKDGEIVAGGLERPVGDEVSAAASAWATIILSETREEFFASVASLDPRSLCVSFGSLRTYADWRYRQSRDPYEHPSTIRFCTDQFPQLDDWVLRALVEPSVGGRKQSLIVYGPSRLGKTLWARSLGRHAYFGGLFSLDEELTEVDYAIFDDMQGGLKFFHGYKFWLGAQKQFYATDKYKGKKMIDWGRPSIYLSNQNPLCDEGVDHDWLLANCVFVELTESIISHANTE